MAAQSASAATRRPTSSFHAQLNRTTANQNSNYQIANSNLVSIEAAQPTVEVVEVVEPVVVQPAPEPDTGPSESEKTAIIAELSGAIKLLQEDLLQMDMEIRRCGRSRSDWRTATIIGGIGVVGTATGAIIQTVQLNKAKKENGDVATDAAASDNKSGDNATE
jgi:hypothetical protein